MYHYSLTQWLLFFFWYCFLGWIWECAYVSFMQSRKEKKWKFVNRGFLHGPLIPIYGFASITILLATIGVRGYTIVVYVVGALTATIFELVTGSAMEKLFKVKYWDYSGLPLNYKGHICFFVSLFWGFFSVLLVQVVHVPVEKFIMKIPQIIGEISAFVLTAVLAYDTAVSVGEGMDLRGILEEIAENNETLQRLEQRINAVAAFAPLSDLKKLPDKQEIRNQLEEHLKSNFERYSKRYHRAASQLRRNPTMISVKNKEHLQILKDLLRNRD